jgi:release factor glutamine methyltransferase
VTVLEVIQRSTGFLARKGVDSPRLQVELILARALDMPRLKLYLQFDRVLTEPELELTRQMVRRRATREPLQHILGSTSFCGFEIIVNPSVLIPRPETEMLAERAWQFLLTRAQEGSVPLLALDFGTGSGCVAIALARHVPAARIHALDISPAALEVARENAGRNDVSSRINFWESDGLEGLPGDLRFDLIVANPPYICSGEIDGLAPEVRDYDPRLALDGGVDGLVFYSKLAREAPARLRKGGLFMCEFGEGQAEAVELIFKNLGWTIEGVEADFSGRARFLIACGERS